MLRPCLFRLDQNHVYRAAPLERLDWLAHGFGTRHSGDWPAPQRPTTLRQVHSTTVVIGDGAPGCAGEGDALVSDRAGCLLAISTADCLPVLIVDQRRRAVAAVHAGWRGVVAGVAAAAVARLVSDFSCRGEDLHAAVGPGIGPCCFRVGPEVAVLFQRLFPERADLDCAALIDLPKAVRRQLTESGLRPERIYECGLCTCCRPAEFYSFRRERGERRRMVSVIGFRVSPVGDT